MSIDAVSCFYRFVFIDLFSSVTGGGSGDGGDAAEREALTLSVFLVQLVFGSSSFPGQSYHDVLALSFKPEFISDSWSKRLLG